MPENQTPPPNQVTPGASNLAACSLQHRLDEFGAMWEKWLEEDENPAGLSKFRDFAEELWMEGWRNGFNFRANAEAETRPKP